MAFPIKYSDTATMDRSLGTYIEISWDKQMFGPKLGSRVTALARLWLPNAKVDIRRLDWWPALTVSQIPVTV